MPGSGKSHWIETHKNQFFGCTVVSRDEIRFSILKGNEDYFSHEREVFREFINQINLALALHETVIVDATHITIGSRRKLLNAIDSDLKKNCTIEIVVIKSDLETIEKQNALRTGRERVPDSAIRRMYHQMTYPTLEEGFDKIYIYDGTQYTIKVKE